MLAGTLDGGAGVLAVLMDGGGVAEGVDEKGPHGLQHLGKERGGGIGVHVDAAHTFIVAVDLNGSRGACPGIGASVENRYGAHRIHAKLSEGE